MNIQKYLLSCLLALFCSQSMVLSMQPDFYLPSDLLAMLNLDAEEVAPTRAAAAPRGVPPLPVLHLHEDDDAPLSPVRETQTPRQTPAMAFEFAHSPIVVKEGRRPAAAPVTRTYARAAQKPSPATRPVTVRVVEPAPSPLHSGSRPKPVATAGPSYAKAVRSSAGKPKLVAQQLPTSPVVVLATPSPIKGGAPKYAPRKASASNGGQASYSGQRAPHPKGGGAGTSSRKTSGAKASSATSSPRGLVATPPPSLKCTNAFGGLEDTDDEDAADTHDMALDATTVLGAGSGLKTAPEAKRSAPEPFNLLDRKPKELDAWLKRNKARNIDRLEGKTLCTVALERGLFSHAKIIVEHNPMLALQKNANGTTSAIELIFDYATNPAMTTLFMEWNASLLEHCKDYDAALQTKLGDGRTTVKQAAIRAGFLYDESTASPTALQPARGKSKIAAKTVVRTREALRDGRGQYFLDPFIAAMANKDASFILKRENDLVLKNMGAFNFSFRVKGDRPFRLQSSDDYFIALTIAIHEKSFWAITQFLQKVRNIWLTFDDFDDMDAEFNLFHMIYKGQLFNGVWTQDELLELTRILCEYGNGFSTLMLLDYADADGNTPLTILRNLKRCAFYADDNTEKVVAYLCERYGAIRRECRRLDGRDSSSSSSENSEDEYDPRCGDEEDDEDSSEDDLD
jgi:hypothetical protein